MLTNQRPEPLPLSGAKQRIPWLTVALVALLLFSGCASQTSNLGPGDASEDGARTEDVAVARLRELAATRTERSPDSSYRLGRGDLIEVSVFGESDMTRKVRIAASGTVSVPLIGRVPALGKTESELAEEIAARLSRDKLLPEPQVDVFVVEYKSQQVAVTGAVAKPGLYSMTRERYTILDMLSEAGGLNKDAGAVIEFVPAESPGAAAAFEEVEVGVKDVVASESISLNLTELMRGSNRALLKLPVVPGDVIFVPEAGSFAIEGWVDRPGTHPLTHGMTVLSALSIGGGPLFPALESSVELVRSDPGAGSPPTVQTVDVEAIRDGKTNDIMLRAGDVVRVPANPFLVPPWAFYSLLRELSRFGASVIL